MFLKCLSFVNFLIIWGAFFAKQKNGLFRVPRQSATCFVGSSWFEYSHQTHRPSTPPAPLQSLAQISGGNEEFFSCKRFGR
jgi:hypothetical protein